MRVDDFAHSEPGLTVTLRPTEAVWNTELDWLLLLQAPPGNGSAPATSTVARLMAATPFASAELLSYALALSVFAVRSADVYWGANKCLALLVSLQLAANAVHALLAYCGASVLYKVTASILHQSAGPDSQSGSRR